MGLIPARAGNTALFWRTTKSAGAHPRSRGEHGCGSSNPELLGEGSSPLARGTHVGLIVGIGAAGLIPARAGNTVP